MIQQHPSPGRHILFCCGDTLQFTLQVPDAGKGQAWLRTNIGHAAAARQEIIREVTQGQPRLAEDWFDFPMTMLDEGQYRLTLPLLEEGHFEAKAFFLREGSGKPMWPEGANTVVNVLPAEYCAGNSLYNAFVRQFGEDRLPDPKLSRPQAKVVQDLTSSGYTIIPPSGTFRDLIHRLDFIIGKLRCRIIMLLPIHPTPTVYARMGQFGCPYAALDFTDVDASLAEFDTRATPMEQFLELVDAVHAREAKLFLDIAVNHTGWAAKINMQHPEWLERDSDGTIHSPGAWGVIWRDLTKLNQQNRELWSYMAEVFLTWCRRGVDGFRCDAGYKIPVPAWEFIVANVRREFPDTIFLLEGLGGKTELTLDLLNKADLNLAYSELFQNYDRRQVASYLPRAFQISATDGLMMHFAETHDNPRLAARSIPYARMRTALAALCSSQGAFAFANGVEWFATEKIDVHGRCSLNWGNSENQVDSIARLNRILSCHPAFFSGTQLRLVGLRKGNSIALLRHQPLDNRNLLVLANLDDNKPSSVTWNLREAGLGREPWIDLLTLRTVSVSIKDELASADLAPAEVLCLTQNVKDQELLLETEKQFGIVPERVTRQCLRAKALEVVRAFGGQRDFSEVDPDRMASDLAEDPREFCRSLNPKGMESLVVTWHWPRDLKREVMIPHRHFLFIHAPSPFRVQVFDGQKVIKQEDALLKADGHYFALLAPMEHVGKMRAYELRLAVFKAGKAEHALGHVLYLPSGEDVRIQTVFPFREIAKTRRLVLSANGRGGMLRARLAWADLQSRYDALLAGNLDTSYPVSRRIMLSRCRAWLVFLGYSREIDLELLQEFVHLDNAGLWRFYVPFGNGQAVKFDIKVEMISGKNATRLSFFRWPADPRQQGLTDDQRVNLIIRPDIDDRDFHGNTKAFLGPERMWKNAVSSKPDGFTFAPDPARQLKMSLSGGTFQVEPKWHYLVRYPVEAERGMDSASDLFSPGYFEVSLRGGDEVVLVAQILTPGESEEIPAVISGNKHYPEPCRQEQEPLPALEQAMRQFIVRRGELNTVIAGYPWFLDWGRDTLICVRGMIAAGMLKETGAILKQFARFEKDATLPNMIQGDQTGDRDTSDAPLWFIQACADWCAMGGMQLLDQPCGKRTMADAVDSVIEGYIRGTPNGIVMDPETGLIFSPAHFTWMDTNYPAGSAREGYPVEIQALWFSALSFWAKFRNNAKYRELAGKVRNSILRYYWDSGKGYLADCLHATAGQSAAKARPDDALRPNQLWALALGAVTAEEVVSRILFACSELLVPGAIRSLADRPVEYQLPVKHNGKLLNDPQNPYWGHYEGDEDTRRKPAYHNGTAWTWLFPVFCESWVMHHGAGSRTTALSLLSSSLKIIAQGCVGQVPEILDGDYPHHLRGCDAQAWGVTELYRVWKKVAGG